MNISTRLLLLCALCLPAALRGAATHPLTGTVADTDGHPVPFATVVLMRADSTQAAGAITADDGAGSFSIAAPAGGYALSVSCVGYRTLEVPVTLPAAWPLTLTLDAQQTQIGAVEVSARFITRQADRFVMNVSGSTQAIGRTADQMLALAPGVWLNDRKLSLNGREGVKVLIGDRQLRMSTEELLQYLKTIPAEDIQRIEVIPTSGADYDADSASGVIRITLRKRRDDGMDGSVSMAGTTTEKYGAHTFSPTGNINYRRGRTSLYGSLSYVNESDPQHLTESTRYTDPAISSISSSTKITSRSGDWAARAGVVWDLRDDHSLGLEANWRRNDRDMSSAGRAQMATPNAPVATHADFDDRGLSRDFGATANYVWRIDSLGSVFKVIGDFQQSHSDSRGDFINSTLSPANIFVPDSVYRNALGNDYRVLSLSAAWERVFSDKFALKAGGKYTRGDMRDRTDYSVRQLPAETWAHAGEWSGVNEYTENISALYAIADMKLWRKLSLSAGLRAEHTLVEPRSAMGVAMGAGGEIALTRQDYLSLFPNVNLSLPLNESQSAQLIFSAARKIFRPPFWALNPMRVPTSRYSYVLGNPGLRPSMRNDVSLTGVLGYKYTLTVGASIDRNEIRQVGYLSDDPEIFHYQFVNIPTSHTLYANLNLPLTPVKRWNANLNATLMNMGNDYAGEERRGTAVQLSLNNTFALPADFSFEVSGWGAFGKMYQGNMDINDMYSVSASLKKRFAKGRLSASLDADNIVTGGQRLVLRGPGYEKVTTSANIWNTWRTWSLSLRYNFRAGKAGKTRNVESAAGDEKLRMSK